MRQREIKDLFLNARLLDSQENWERQVFLLNEHGTKRLNDLLRELHSVCRHKKSIATTIVLDNRLRIDYKQNRGNEEQDEASNDCEIDAEATETTRGFSRQ